jgi:hypothetical protein
MEGVPPPTIVGGVGGSGTRIFARILLDAGVYMGANRNHADDALDFVAFTHRWLGPYWAAWQRGRPLPEHGEMRAEFEHCVREYRSAMRDPTAPWAWKQPRTMHFLPFYREVFESIRFVHVIRDGRDLAFGRANPLRRAGDVVLGPDAPAEPQAVRMMRFWGVANTATADDAERNMPDGYLRVRFEDLCADPLDTARLVLSFAGSESSPGTDMLAEIQRPPSLGRWRDQDPELVRRVEQTGGAALERFGYLNHA